jgi:hypothetical protein
MSAVLFEVQNAEVPGVCKGKETGLESSQARFSLLSRLPCFLVWLSVLLPICS